MRFDVYWQSPTGLHIVCGLGAEQNVPQISWNNQRVSYKHNIKMVPIKHSKDLVQGFILLFFFFCNLMCTINRTCIYITKFWKYACHCPQIIPLPNDRFPQSVARRLRQIKQLWRLYAMAINHHYYYAFLLVVLTTTVHMRYSCQKSIKIT